jgi:ubiquinone/menaquinone biosynthesis C-methylase UbiE
MTSCFVRRSVPTFVTLAAFVLAPAFAAAQSAQQDVADAERLIKVLEIRAGSTVGEIGAGGGELSIAMARAAGESGRVFSNELNPDRLKALVKKLEDAGVTNATPVEGRPAETNFPAACCDAIFMRNVYHHFEDPAAMNASLFKSLKPGGRLAVIDFTPPGTEATTPAGRSADNFHGVLAPTVARELKAAGFEVLSAEATRRTVTVIARRPLEPCPEQAGSRQ